MNSTDHSSRLELIHNGRTFGEKASDRVSSAMGSWKFIIIQTCIVALWVAGNLIGWLEHWDPYPFILLNLAFSLQAAYSTPVIMMSQNRQAAKDRKRDDRDDQEIGEIHHQTGDIHKMQMTQMDHHVWEMEELRKQTKDLAAIARVLKVLLDKDGLSDEPLQQLPRKPRRK